MLKTILKILLAIALTGYAVTALLWSRANADARPCQSIFVTVANTDSPRFVTAREVARDLGNLYTQSPGKPIGMINTHAIVQRLDSIDKIENATATFLTDGSIEVNVTPMLPVARLFPKNEKSFYINKQGKRILATARYHVNVPVVSTNDPAFAHQQILPLINFLHDNPKWDSLITHIKILSPNNIILVPMIHGHVLNIGSINDLQSKFDRIETAYRQIMPIKGWEFYDTLSVKWKGQIVATRRTKKLAPVVNPADYEAEREEPDLGTMMTGEALTKATKPTAKKQQ